MDLLTCTIPLLILSAVWSKRRIDWFLAGIGFLALMLPLRRANLIAVVIVPLFAHCMKIGKIPRKAVLATVLLLCSYVGSQLAFSRVLNPEDWDMFALGVASSTFPEVRDVGWTMSLLGNERWNGMTFLQALNPVPSFMSEFTQKYSIRAVTTRFVDWGDQRSGGLRLMMTGEAFMNFGYAGPVAIGLLFGFLCGYVELTVHALNGRDRLWAYSIAAQLIVWLCLWLYLAGTSAAAPVKVGLILVGSMILVSLRRNPSRALASHAHAGA
jgi:hypothetical protein